MKLKDYIQGNRHGKESNQLEREAMNDPFLQDAIDGFDEVQGDHLSVINSLEKNFNKKSAKKQFKLKYWIVGIAASVFLVVGVGTLFLIQKEEQKQFAQNTIHKTKNSRLENRLEVPSLQNEPVENIQLNEKHSKNIKPIKDIQNNTIEEDIMKLESVQDVVTKENLIENSNYDANIIQEEVVTEIAQFRDAGPNSATQKESNIISGKIVDEKGEAIVGVSVMLKDSYTSVVTDMNGNFSLKMPNNKYKTLVASYIGYQKKEVPITTESSIIQLEPDNLALNEIVVVGYGSKRRSSMIGSISAIPTKSITYGEKEFVKYVKENHKLKICFQKNDFIQVKFSTDPTGKPINLEIIESACSQLEIEFIQLFKNSPNWTEKLKKVELKIRF